MKSTVRRIHERQRLLCEHIQMLAEESKDQLPEYVPSYTQAMVEASKEISRIMMFRLLLGLFAYFLFYLGKLSVKSRRR